MEKGKLLYEGKAKQVYATDDNDLIIMHYKNDATAGNGAKHAQFESKGMLNNKITTIIYNILIKKGIPTHYIETLNDTDQLCRKVTIFPLEVICRNIIAGSMAKRLGLEEGKVLEHRVFELSYKSDALGDPMVNDDQAIAVGACTYEELAEIKKLTFMVDDVLIELFKKVGIKLVDFKLEFGRTSDGKIVLADEISPDCMRLWDAETNDHLDKDRFRRDLGDVMGAYREVYKRLSTLND
jgi:phosphoribosylaminoimidazole-succinocarboxamide synthase